MAEFPCAMCAQNCDIDVIQCTNCKNWVHRLCVPMSASKFQSWSGDSLDFLCRNCCFLNGQFDATAALSRYLIYLFIYLFILLFLFSSFVYSFFFSFDHPRAFFLSFFLSFFLTFFLNAMPDKRKKEILRMKEIESFLPFYLFRYCGYTFEQP